MSSQKTKRKEEETAISWLPSVLVAFLLITLGFLGGVIGGIATEESDLAWTYAKSVISGSILERGSQNFVEIPHPNVMERVDESIDPSGTGDQLSEITIQVGAFSNQTQALQMVEMLRGEGYKAYETSDGSTHRVRIGPLYGRDNVETMVRELASRGFSTWITEK